MATSRLALKLARRLDGPIEIKQAPHQPTYEFDAFGGDVLPLHLTAQEGISVAEIGDGTGNSVVVAVLQVIATRFPEPPLEVYRGDQIQQFHPAKLLMDKPNEWDTADLLWHYAMFAVHADGNAYIWKARNIFGDVVELHPLLPDLVEPEGGGRSRITFYKYTPDGREIKIPPEDMIHLRIGVDPRNHRRGIAPLKSALREIYGDEQASRFTTALTKNTGVPAVLISPKDEDGPDEDEGDRIVSKWNEKVGGDRRGSALFLNGPVEVHRLSFSPKDMDLTALRRLPEERVAAVVGVPPILAGLGTGLEKSSGRNETRELIEAFTEGKLIPMWRNIGQQMTKDLLREFTADVDMAMRFNITEVRALQGDRQRRWQRVANGYVRGLVTRREARDALQENLKSTSEDEVYFTDISGGEGAEDLSSVADDGTLDPEGGSSNGRLAVQNT